MNLILVKVFATALAMSQVTTRPDAVRTEFDPVRDRAEVGQLLKDGCTHMRRAFDIEDINLDDLIATAMEDPEALTGEVKVLQGLNIGDLHAAYRQFCKNEGVESGVVDLGAVIGFYNKAAADLPDHTKLKGTRLPGMSVVLDHRGERFAEVFEPDHRRVWVPLGDIPDHVRQAFVSAEDKRFREHRGIDERGVVRAFIGNLAQPGRPQGGSTITQQVAKNLLVGDDVTYERKIREMIVASRLERSLSKDEILEAYLNAIFLGRGAWGVEMAARSHFGKSVKELTVEEGALLAGLAKGPNYYDPRRRPDRARERLAYVLTRMQEDGAVQPERVKQALAGDLPQLAGTGAPRRDSGFHFTDHLNREVRTFAGVGGLTASSYTVRSTIHPALQRATESALQEGLARYELNTGRMRFEGAEANLAEAVRRIEERRAKADPAEPAPEATAATGPKAGAKPKAAAKPREKPAWQEALESARLPLYDVQWPAAVVLQTGKALRVGLEDGRTTTLSTFGQGKTLKPYDVVRVRLAKAKGGAVTAQLRMRPAVQGAAVVLENRTGRVLAMAGGFSYPLSQLNRVTQAQRQPGSAIKPVTFLAALSAGLQPNTLVWDTPVTLPAPGGGGDSWSPKNFDGGSAGLMTLRRGLENSKNLVTAHLLDGGIASSPERSLKRVCELSLEAGIYVDCVPYYPFVLGAQPLRLLDLAAFYATIANEGARPSPYALESVEEGGNVLYRREPRAPVRLGSADPAAFYQLKSILQGVLERGTGRPIRSLSPYVAGKTGTSDGENDAWFAGFTNEVTVVVWVGYDNADGKRRTLGRGQTGGKVAIPIAEPIFQAAWAHHGPRTALAPPSPEAARRLTTVSINLQTGDPQPGGGFKEHFRLDGSGRLAETQFRLVPQAEVYAFRNPDPWSDGEASGWAEENHGYAYGRQVPWEEIPQSGRYNRPPPAWSDQPTWGDAWEEMPRRRQRRVDPDYFWGPQRIY